MFMMVGPFMTLLLLYGGMFDVKFFLIFPVS